MQQKWEEFYQAHKFFHLDPHEALPGFADKLKNKGYRRILDLGCGAGQDLLFLAEKGFEVEGVDFSPAAAANAEDLLQSKNLPGKVYVDNLFDRVTTFKSESYPGIIAINSLENTDFETFQTSIAEVKRILSNHGFFLLVVSSEKSKLKLEVEEQLFFEEDQLVSVVNKHFKILDFWTDTDNNFVLLLEK